MTAAVNDLTFFTNEKGRKLIDRFKTLFRDTKELDIIVGHFYLSGIYQLYEELKRKAQDNLEININFLKNFFIEENTRISFLGFPDILKKINFKEILNFY